MFGWTQHKSKSVCRLHKRHMQFNTESQSELLCKHHVGHDGDHGQHPRIFPTYFADFNALPPLKLPTILTFGTIISMLLFTKQHGTVVKDTESVARRHWFTSWFLYSPAIYPWANCFIPLCCFFICDIRIMRRCKLIRLFKRLNIANIYEVLWTVP